MAFSPRFEPSTANWSGENNELFTVSSRNNYVRGEVNEEDVGEVKPGMEAVVQLYAYRTQHFHAQSLFDSTGGGSGNAAVYHYDAVGKAAR